MGIQSFLSHVQDYAQDTNIADLAGEGGRFVCVDESGVKHYILDRVSAWEAHDDYAAMATRMMQLFLAAGIHVKLVLDGVSPLGKLQTVMARFEGRIKKAATGAVPLFAGSAVSRALKSVPNIEVVYAPEEADPVIAELAADDMCVGILTDDSDFLVYDNLPAMLIMKTLNCDTGSVRSLTREGVANGLGLTISQFRDVVTCLGNDVFDMRDDWVKKTGRAPGSSRLERVVSFVLSGRRGGLSGSLTGFEERQRQMAAYYRTPVNSLARIPVPGTVDPGSALANTWNLQRPKVKKLLLQNPPVVFEPVMAEELRGERSAGRFVLWLRRRVWSLVAGLGGSGLRIVRMVERTPEGRAGPRDLAVAPLVMPGGLTDDVKLLWAIGELDDLEGQRPAGASHEDAGGAGSLDDAAAASAAAGAGADAVGDSDLASLPRRLWLLACAARWLVQECPGDGGHAAEKAKCVRAALKPHTGQRPQSFTKEYQVSCYLRCAVKELQVWAKCLGLQGCSVPLCNYGFLNSKADTNRVMRFAKAI